MDAQRIFDAFLANLPQILVVLTALGMWHVVAAIGRKLWDAYKAHAKKTPSKLDDAVVAAVDPQVQAIFDLIDRGEALPTLQAKVAEVKRAKAAIGAGAKKIGGR